MTQLEKKEEKLRRIIRSMQSVAVAFSGGTDSTLVAKIARDELKDKAIAVTIDSPLFPARELNSAKEMARKIGIAQVVISADPLTSDRFVSNPANRCYLCKLEDLKEIKQLAHERGLKHVVDGSNAEDHGDYRPGTKAKEELGVRSPLAQAGLKKSEVRAISRSLGLPTASKPSSPCLASRIPYGEPITREKLRMIEDAEDFLIGKGFENVRVRMHGSLARIEVPAEDIGRLSSPGVRLAVAKRMRSLGFTYVAIDMEGYRMGSLNEVL